MMMWQRTAGKRSAGLQTNRWCLNNGEKEKTEIQTSCDTCAYLIYDEEYEEYVCDVSMDEDEIARLYGDGHYTCPYYKNGDEYRVVRHQM